MADTPKPAAKNAKGTRWRAKSAEQTAEKDTILPQKKRKVPEIAGKHSPIVKSVQKTVKKTAKTQAKATSNARAGAKQPYVDMTEQVIDAVLSEIAGGKSMVKVCLMPGMPNRTAFLKRVAEDDELQTRYAMAMSARADKYAEETIDIADDGSNDTYLDEEGNKRTDQDVVARSKLRIAARQWYAAKIAPKKYGDKVDVNHGGQEGNPIQALLSQISGSALPIIKENEEE